MRIWLKEYCSTCCRATIDGNATQHPTTYTQVEPEIVTRKPYLKRVQRMWNCKVIIINYINSWKVAKAPLFLVRLSGGYKMQ